MKEPITIFEHTKPEEISGSIIDGMEECMDDDVTGSDYVCGDDWPGVPEIPLPPWLTAIWRISSSSRWPLRGWLFRSFTIACMAKSIAGSGPARGVRAGFEGRAQQCMPSDGFVGETGAGRAGTRSQGERPRVAGVTQGS